MPGMGRFLFLPMTLAVMFAMTTAYFLSRTLVPCASAFLLPHHGHERQAARPIGRAFARWEELDRPRHRAVRPRRSTSSCAIASRRSSSASRCWPSRWSCSLPIMRRDFFPEADSGAFEIAVRAPSGTRIEITEEHGQEGRELHPQEHSERRPATDRLARSA